MFQLLAQKSSHGRSRCERGTSGRESAYDMILSALIFGDLAPGSAVDEKRIAARFGVGLAASA